MTITCMLLLLMLVVWLPVSAAGADEKTSELATPVTATVQATPTEDATVTALNKEKLAQEIQQLKNQNAPDSLGWIRTNVAILFSTLAVVFGGLFGLWRWIVDRREAQKKELEDRKAEREKLAEERFQAAVIELGDEREGAKISAATALRTFLRPDPDYKQFYTQTFDLSVANLRLPRTSHPVLDPNTPLPLTPLSQALIVVFKEAFPRTRDAIIEDRKEEDVGHVMLSLDATNIQLDNALLLGADLKQIYMPQAYLRHANLTAANLTQADLKEAHLSSANLNGANLTEAYLRGADLRKADLTSAILFNADITHTDLTFANLTDAHLNGAHLRDANLTDANLTLAQLTDASITHANLTRANLTGANLTDARNLAYTNLHDIKGLTKEQLEVCKAKGAIIDDDPTTSSPKPTIAPSPPSPSNDVQTLDTSDSNVTFPKPSTES